MASSNSYYGYNAYNQTLLKSSADDGFDNMFQGNRLNKVVVGFVPSKAAADKKSIQFQTLSCYKYKFIG